MSDELMRALAAFIANDPGRLGHPLRPVAPKAKPLIVKANEHGPGQSLICYDCPGFNDEARWNESQTYGEHIHSTFELWQKVLDEFQRATSP